MRTATRGRVHKSVLKPWARAPRRSSQSRRSICRALNRGLRPARPAPRSPRTPPRFHCLYHRLTLWRLTPSRREISAMIHFPAANMQAAWLRRCSNAAKSRRTRNLVGMPTLYAQRECLSLYYARFSRSQQRCPYIPRHTSGTATFQPAALRPRSANAVGGDRDGVGCHRLGWDLMGL